MIYEIYGENERIPSLTKTLGSFIFQIQLGNEKGEKKRKHCGKILDFVVFFFMWLDNSFGRALA